MKFLQHPAHKIVLVLLILAIIGGAIALVFRRQIYCWNFMRNAERNFRAAAQDSEGQVSMESFEGMRQVLTQDCRKKMGLE